MQLQPGLHLHLPHLAGVGKGEVEVHIGQLPGRAEVAHGGRAVAGHLYVEVVHFDELVGCLVDMCRHLANGELAAQPAAHQGRAGLGDVELELCRGGHGLDVGHVHDVAYLQMVGAGLAKQVLTGAVDGEAELQLARLGLNVAPELLALSDDVERTRIVDGAQLVQLFHHKLLDAELVDDALLLAADEGGLVHVEVQLQPVLVLQVDGVSRRLHQELAGGALDHDVVEPQAAVVAVDAHTELQRQCELAQDGGEGGGYVAKHRRAADGGGGIMQAGGGERVGQVHDALVEVQLGLALLQMDVVQLECLVGKGHLALQSADVDARQRVAQGAVGQVAVHHALADAVDLELHVGPYVQVARVEGTALGSAAVLALAVVVGLQVEPL